MAAASSVSIAVVARASPLPQTASATLHWDGRSGVGRDAGPHTLLEHVQHLHAHDPLLHHMALVLRAAIEGEGVAEQLYATSLADALVVHFLRRYAASRQSLRQAPSGLAPSKLRRTIAYIKAHLEQVLSLAELAAVAQTSPTHFARLFKRATGLAPHRYVITSRMEQAKRLLATTDVSLSDIGLQVGCADQSHFTALFRKYVSTTPKAYRNTTRSTFL